MRPKLFCHSFLLLLSLLIFKSSSRAQETEEIPYSYNIPENENLSEEQLSQLHEQLEQFKKHPVKLNQASEQSLKEIFFLNPLQIYHLLAHIRINGPLQELSELQVIPGFSPDFIRQIAPYISINTNSGRLPQIKTLFHQTEQELLVRHTLIHQQKKGFQSKGASAYSGDPSHLLVKYKLLSRSGLAIRLLMEKDPGETFPAPDSPLGFDFISGNISYQGKHKKAMLVIGDYSLSFGQGLSLWTGFAFGRGADLAGTAKKDAGLQPYFSADEQQYFRGIAYKHKLLQKITLTTFISSKKSDAAIQFSADGQGVISHISSSGLHRTAAEVKNRHSLRETILGAAIQYEYRFLNIGITTYQSSYSLPFITGKALYRSHYFSGNSRENTAIHYNYTWRNSYLFGEYAASIPGGPAWIQGLISGWSRKLSSVLILRNYHKDHISFYAAPFGQNSDAINEKGIYAGLNYQIQPQWLLAAYLDLFSFPFAKYRTDLPSTGHEYALKLYYRPNKTSKYSIQYRSSAKQQNNASGLQTPVLDQVNIQTFRMDAEYQLHRQIKLRHITDLSSYRKGITAASYGLLLADDLYYQPPGPISANIRIAWFSIPAYDNRLYRYENNVQYGAASVAYQGNGYRSYFNIAYNLNRQLKVWLRYAITWLPGTSKMGTGMEEIQGGTKSETRVQLRYNF